MEGAKSPGTDFDQSEGQLMEPFLKPVDTEKGLV